MSHEAGLRGDDTHHALERDIPTVSYHPELKAYPKVSIFVLCSLVCAALGCSKPSAKETNTTSPAAGVTGGDPATNKNAGRPAEPAGDAGASPVRTVPNPIVPKGGGGAGGVPAAGGGGAVAAGSAAMAGAGAAGQAAPAPNVWLMMGYDEKNWYFNPAEKTLSVDNASQLVEKWRFTVAGLPCGSPVVAEGKVFAMASGGTYAIDLETGTEIWKREDLIGTASVAYDDGYIYVHHSLPPRLYKLKASDGSTVWGPMTSYDAANSSGESSPIVAGDKVLVGHESGLREISFDVAISSLGRGGVEAYDKQTGRKLWTYFTIPEEPNAGGENGASVWSSVSVDVGSATVFATTGNNYTVTGPNSEAFHAIDLATGTRKWVNQVITNDLSFQYTLDPEQDRDFGANPILADIAGQRLIAAGEKGASFWVLDRDTGKLLWSRKALSPTYSALAGGVFINGAFDGSYFYVVSNTADAGAFLHKLDPANQGASVWTHEFNDFSWGASSLANGLLVVPNNTVLYIMNAENGSVLKQFDTGGTIAGGAAAIAQGKIIVKSGLIYTDLRVKLNDKIICYGLPSSGSPAAGSGGSGTAGKAGGAAGSGGSSGTGSMPAKPSFAAIYQEIIVNTGCNSGQCHSGPAAGGLSLMSRDTAYANLVGVAAMGTNAPNVGGNCADSGLLRVAPGDPDRSLLVLKLEHTQPCGAPMPNAGMLLPAAQLQQVRTWIADGAMNN